LTVSGNNYGLDFLRSNNNTIISNMCESNWVGIRLEGSVNNTLKYNVLINCEGVSLYTTSMNYLEGNTVKGNILGIGFSTLHSNYIYRNNFIQNYAQVGPISLYQNIWDNGFEGNFWGNYESSDLDKNGIVDVEYAIDANDKDHCPLSGPYQSFEISDEANLQEVSVVSNSTVYDLIFENSNRTLMLTVEGANGTIGFCRICILHTLIKPELTVIIDGGLVDVLYANYNVLDNGLHRWIYFEYVTQYIK